MQIRSRPQIKSSRCTTPLLSGRLESARFNSGGKRNFTVAEDENCVNLIESKTAQQMQLISVTNDKIKPTRLNPTYVNVNLTTSQAYEGITLEHASSEYKDVFDGLGTPLRLEVHEEVKTFQQPLRRVPEERMP